VSHGDTRTPPEVNGGAGLPAGIFLVERDSSRAIECASPDSPAREGGDGDAADARLAEGLARDDGVEMANLTTTQTGVPGTILSRRRWATTGRE